MNYKLGNKTIKIPDAEIEVSMKNLDLTKEEAIQMWLEDEGYLDNEEQVELTAKAKASKIMQTIHGAESEDKKAKKTQRERVKKEDPEKTAIIQKIAEILPEIAENVKITNETKIIEFNIGENEYKIDLTRKRKPKN